MISCSFVANDIRTLFLMPKALPGTTATPWCNNKSSEKEEKTETAKVNSKNTTKDQAKTEEKEILPSTEGITAEKEKVES